MGDGADMALDNAMDDFDVYDRWEQNGSDIQEGIDLGVLNEYGGMDQFPFALRNYKNTNPNTWIGRYGKAYDISSMSTQHIENTLALIRNTSHVEQYSVSKAYLALSKELRKRGVIEDYIGPTCKYCGVTGLRWVPVGGHWFLYNQIGRHKCDASIVFQETLNTEENNMVKQVAVVFKTDKGTSQVYHYLTDLEDLNTGDYVVVHSKNGYGVAEVQGYVPVTKIATAWVVQKVDINAYEERQARLKAIKKLETEIEAACAVHNKLSLWKQLAQDNQDVRVMVERLEELLKG